MTTVDKSNNSNDSKGVLPPPNVILFHTAFLVFYFRPLSSLSFILLETTHPNLLHKSLPPIPLPPVVFPQPSSLFFKVWKSLIVFFSQIEWKTSQANTETESVWIYWWVLFGSASIFVWAACTMRTYSMTGYFFFHAFSSQGTRLSWQTNPTFFRNPVVSENFNDRLSRQTLALHKLVSNCS